MIRSWWRNTGVLGASVATFIIAEVMLYLFSSEQALLIANLLFLVIVLLSVRYPEHATVLSGIIGCVYLCLAVVLIPVPDISSYISLIMQGVVFASAGTVISSYILTLENSDIRYREIFDRALCGICIADRRCMYPLEYNRPFAAIRDGDPDSLTREIIVALQEGGGMDGDDTLSTINREIAVGEQSGKIKHLLVSTAPLAGERILIQCTDITSLRETEKDLKLSQERLSLAVEGAGVEIWDCDPISGTMELGSDLTSLKDWGDGEASIPIAAWMGRINPDDREVVEQGIRDHLEGRHPEIRCEYRLKNGDGGWRWIQSSGRVTECSDDGTPLRITGIHLDSTESVTIRGALRAANHKNAILAGISRHDILNQVTAMLGYLHLLEERIVADAVGGQYLRSLRDLCLLVNRQTVVSGELYAIGSVDPVWQSLEAVIMRIRAFLSLDEIHLNELRGNVEIFADPLLYRAFTEIFMNSVQHGRGARCIDCAVSVSGSVCSVIITDDGTGIPAEKKELIFKRGYGEGAGMGLFLASEILSATGISIYENGEAGAGARFVITIPPGCFRTISCAGVIAGGLGTTDATGEVQ
ncbi:sensor histidine kinase [Methanofollis fontis]|nr:HAMP domain-containing sensor histidine kinase [Methanofollis fontis]